MSEPTPKELATERAAGLRALADLIEATPEVDANYLDNVSVWHVRDPEHLAVIVRAGLAAGAKIDKQYYDDGDLLKVSIALGRVKAEALTSRNLVCERVVVGTETVTQKVPDPDALAKVPVVEQTIERELVEWKCAPLLEAGAS